MYFGLILLETTLFCKYTNVHCRVDFMAERYHTVLGEGRRDVTGFTFSLVLTPVTDGQTWWVETEVRVCCEVGLTERDYTIIVNLTETEFPLLLDECLRLVTTLREIVEQNSEEAGDL